VDISIAQGYQFSTHANDFVDRTACSRLTL